jgi:hypothetical protein
MEEGELNKILSIRTKITPFLKKSGSSLSILFTAF